MDGFKPVVALVGGNGFIGRRLVAQLRNSCDLRVIDLHGFSAQAQTPCFRADIQNPVQLLDALQGASEIVHLAAVHRDDVLPASRYFDVNVEGTRNLCEAARQLGIVRIVFVSSVAVYGFQPGVSDETTVPHPFNPYGQSKLQAEEVLREWQREDPSRALTIVRPPAVFGPGNRGNVYNLISHLARGRFVMVGEGTNRKSMAYVENLAAFLAHLVVLQHPAGNRLYNYCDKPDLSMNELLRILRQALGKRAWFRLRLPYWMGLSAGYLLDLLAGISGHRFPISAVRIRKFCANTLFDSTRIAETGFKAPYALEEALAVTIADEFGNSAANLGNAPVIAPTRPDG